MKKFLTDSAVVIGTVVLGCAYAFSWGMGIEQLMWLATQVLIVVAIYTVIKDFETKLADKDMRKLLNWKDYVWSEDFLSSCLSFFLRLLHHSRIRTVQTTGTLGLSQPHQTGMLSGFLYMLLPQAAQDLQFDFLNEIYDCHIQIAGRIYPGVIVLYAFSFIVSPPVRRLLWAVRQHRKEFAHG